MTVFSEGRSVWQGSTYLESPELGSKLGLDSRQVVHDRLLDLSLSCRICKTGDGVCVYWVVRVNCNDTIIQNLALRRYLMTYFSSLPFIFYLFQLSHYAWNAVTSVTRLTKMRSCGILLEKNLKCLYTISLFPRHLLHWVHQ